MTRDGACDGTRTWTCEVVPWGMYQGTAPVEYMTPGKSYESAMPTHGMTHGKAAIPLPYIGRAEERMQ